jgi:hypothetical protein
LFSVGRLEVETGVQIANERLMLWSSTTLQH